MGADEPRSARDQIVQKRLLCVKGAGAGLRPTNAQIYAGATTTC